MTGENKSDSKANSVGLGWRDYIGGSKRGSQTPSFLFESLVTGASTSLAIQFPLSKFATGLFKKNIKIKLMK